MMDGQITPAWIELTAEIFGIRDIEHFIRQLNHIRNHRKAAQR